MRRGIATATLLGVLVSASGCVLFAGKTDYADYRSIRLAADPGERALAMRRYVEKHPDGQWREEIDEQRKAQELTAFEVGKDSREGLTHYLEAYPDGTYVSQARSRLEAISLIEQQRKQAKQQAEQLAEARKRRAQELRRTWLGRFLGYWLDTLVSLDGWGEPISAVAGKNPQFSRAFGALPRPRCTQDECVKYYASAYAIPVPGGNRIERQLSLLLRLRMRSGKLERAELLLPDWGFSRWYELEERHAVSSGERADREQAVAWAIKRAAPLIEAIAGVSEATGGTLPKIEAPAIGPTGELIDTSIEKPSDPQNTVSSEDNAGIGVDAAKAPAPTTAEMLKPQAPAENPDMVFEAMGVGKQGQRVEAAAAPASSQGPTGASAAAEMTFSAPLEVPRTGPADTTAGSGAEAEPPPEQPATSEPMEPVLRAFQAPGLRISLFAAGSDGQGYDGVVIERASGKKPAAKPQPAAKPAAPAPAARQPPAASPKPSAPVAGPAGSAGSTTTAAPAKPSSAPASSAE